MSFLSNLAMNAIMKTSHPELDRRQCWNLRPHKERCEDCMNICPKHIYVRAGMVNDWMGCTDCGLCVSVCRARCIAPSPEQVRHDTDIADTRNDRVWIGCDKSTRHNDLIRDCVGALPWEAAAYLAMHKKIVYDLTPCEECDNENCKALMRKNLQRLLEFLGAPLFEARVLLAQKEDDYPYEAKGLSRREMMESLTEDSRSGTHKLLKMIPGLEDEARDRAMDYRLMLYQAVKETNAGGSPIPFGFWLPSVNDKCFGCGRCETTCRSGALKITKGADGLTRFVVTPWKCCECGLCERACMEHAIDGMKLRQLTTLGPVSLKKFQMVLCRECGKPVSPTAEDGLCRVCTSRKKMQERREEAARRAKERAEQRAKEAAEKEAAQKAADEQAAAAAAAGETAQPAVPAAAETPAAAVQETAQTAAPAAAETPAAAVQEATQAAVTAAAETPAAAVQETAQPAVPAAAETPAAVVQENTQAAAPAAAETPAAVVQEAAQPAVPAAAETPAAVPAAEAAAQN